jgi:hypothetical protein
VVGSDFRVLPFDKVITSLFSYSIGTSMLEQGVGISPQAEGEI